MLFAQERSGKRLSCPASAMSSGGSFLLLLLLFLFWGDFALCSPVIRQNDNFEDNCGLYPHHHKKCGQPVHRFFLHPKSKKCERYTDYQCPFAGNRYNTMEQCEENCAPKNVCNLPPNQGICNYKRERWFFNPKTKSCESINHKGCTRNNNNFKRKSVCEQICL